MPKENFCNSRRKNSKTQLQGQKQLQMHKSKCRMNEQEKHYLSKANSTNTDLNTCVEEEISNTEFQKKPKKKKQ
jgi:hypothetical protein